MPLKKTVYTRTPRRRGTPHHRGPHRKRQGVEIRAKLSLRFLRKGTGKAGETGLGLVGLNNFSRLWKQRLPLEVWTVALG